MALRKRLQGLAIGFVLILALSLVGLRTMYGGGATYRDVSTPTLLPAEAARVLVELDLPPGNVASSADGRTFFNLHPFAEPWRFSESVVFELVSGKPRPYPDRASQAALRGTLGMTVDRQGRLWMVNPSGLEPRKTRLVAYDLATNRLCFEHEFEASFAPFAQDLSVAPDGKTVYLADTGVLRFTSPALIVLDVATRKARRVLEAHPSVSPEDWIIQTPNGPHTLFYGLVTFSVGVDGLAQSPDGEWLYFATMSHGQAYRIRTRVLRDHSVRPEELVRFVERVGDKPLSDGIVMDAASRLYLTDIEHGSIAVLGPDRSLRTLVRVPTVRWADGMALGAGGELLFTDSAIPAYLDPLLRSPSREALRDAGPYRIYSVDLRALTKASERP